MNEYILLKIFTALIDLILLKFYRNKMESKKASRFCGRL
jgi:hypothetical protein